MELLIFLNAKLLSLLMIKHTRSSFFSCLFISRHSLEVATSDETYFMYANTEKEKDEWIGAIGRYEYNSYCYVVLLFIIQLMIQILINCL